MDRLPEPLTSFRQFVEADLRRAARLVIKVQDEIDPQFRISTPAGDWHLAVTLPPGANSRQVLFECLGLFMIGHKALGFLKASEITEPQTGDDAVYSVGITAGEQHHCLSRIARDPRPWTKDNFGPVEWLPNAAIDPILLDLLPRTHRALSRPERKLVTKWFGPRGKFPAIQMQQDGPTGHTKH